MDKASSTRCKIAFYDFGSAAIMHRHLIDMAQSVDGKWVVEHAPAKQEIARMIGASREMVSRVVKDLQRKGLIRAEKRRIYVLDKLSMQRRASTSHSNRRRA